MPEAAEPLLQVRDLRTWFLTDAGAGARGRRRQLHLHRGETLGIVGESGSGKSVAPSRSCACWTSRRASSAARSRFAAARSRRWMKRRCAQVRGREIAMVFQDPMTSLNPVLRIAKQLIEAMTAHGRFTPDGGTSPRGLAAAAAWASPAPDRAVECLAAPVLRRDAPARDAGDGLLQRAVADHRRRADHRAGRDDPGADPRPAARAERRSRHRGHPDQPRPRRHRQRSARACW